MNKFKYSALVSTACLALISRGICQNALQFTSVNTTAENAVQLRWSGNSNELYEIDYADALNANPDGGTTWNKLYTDYPSQGTNTMVADCGNYDITPEIVHPSKSPARFYRVIQTSTGTSPTNPTVHMVYPSNGASISGDVTFSVFASSPEILDNVELYIDGEQQWPTVGGTNFEVNTCEWLNGQHTIYAIAKSSANVEGFSFGTAQTYGYSVSPFITVTFSNLVSEVALSQSYFEPSLGETQEVTAQFAADCDWTLQIQDPTGNTVRNVSGSGSSMSFDWDGTGDGETNISDGCYNYLITASTNGGTLSGAVRSLGSGGGPATPMFSSSVSFEESQLYIVDGFGGFSPLAIYPPGFDTNGMTIIDATPSDMASVSPVRPARASSFAMTSEFSANANYAGPSTQTTTAPKRKPRIGVKNSSGTFGICYYTYPTGSLTQEPTTGWPPPLRIFTGIDGTNATSSYHYFTPLKSDKDEADAFSTIMKIGGDLGSYKSAFVKGDNQWGVSDIVKPSLGGSSLFNTCNFGLLLTHGVYGTQSEDDNVKYTYLYLANPNSAGHWVRLSDLDLGSDGPTGLKWFTTLSCQILHPANVTSMINNSRMPDNGNLHLLLGATTDTYASPLLTMYYATNMVFNTSIWQSLQNAGQLAYQEMHDSSASAANQMNIPVTFRVMGYQSCISDTIFQYNDPDPNSSYQIINQTVYSP